MSDPSDLSDLSDSSGHVVRDPAAPDNSDRRPPEPLAAETTVLEMRGITKRFPEVLANDHIDFSLRKGEIHALLGENGAGKTTLMKILYGLYGADEGEILLAGRRVTIDSPRRAIGLGIGMVHQHFMLIQPFTVAENIVLGEEPSKQFGFLDMKSAVDRVSEISARYGLKIDPRARVENISVGMQQRVEILKALYRQADILILDEPTAVLTPQEVGELGQILKSLTSQGKSIIFITHKLKEVMRFCDRVTVIRRGRRIDTVEVRSTTMDQLARMMVGREVVLSIEKAVASPGRPLLQLVNVEAMGNRGVKALRGVSLTVRAGEIVGIAGVEGNGQSELAQVITGLLRVTAGEIVLDGEKITNMSTKKILSRGVSHVPEDRQKSGLVLDFTAWENTILQTYDRHPTSTGIVLHQRRAQSYAARLAQEFDVRPPSPMIPAKSLSGGNQQKLVLARELDRAPKLLIVAQPTRGLDVGAIEFVHKRIIDARDAGSAVLLISLELDEIMQLSDRIAVMYEGRIAGMVRPEETSEEELGLMMTGAKTISASEGGESARGDSNGTDT